MRLYLRLVDSSRVQWQNRSHFFAVSAQLMRRILVDYARAHRSQKRGGEMTRVSLEGALPLAHEREPDLVALDEALQGWLRSTLARAGSSSFASSAG